MNKVYKVLWDSRLNRWVVTSELGKSRSKCTKILLSAGLVAALFMLNAPSFAAVCSAGDETSLQSALNNSSCSVINVKNNIDLNNNITATVARDVTINGGGYIINTASKSIMFTGNSTGTANVNVLFDNFSGILSDNQIRNAVFVVNDVTSKINIQINNISELSDSTLALLGSGNYGSTKNSQNPHSEIRIGNITEPVKISARAFKQFVNGARIRFTGKMALNGEGDGGINSYVFWSNSDVDRNKVFFDTEANVAINLTKDIQFTTGNRSGEKFAYYFADGSQFTLWSAQNVLGEDIDLITKAEVFVNAGVVIGSYDKVNNVWGSGAIINIAGVNGDSLTGDGLTNKGGLAAGIDNDTNGKEDVVFNLAAGSSFKVNGAGINVRKSNNTGIYVRSASNITAANGIIITHDGTGDTVLANHGVITSTAAGIQLNSNSGSTMKLDQVSGNIHGEINAKSGDAIIVGSDPTSGNVNLVLNGGIISASGTATNAINFTNASAQNNQKITDLKINLLQGNLGSAFVLNSANPTNVSLNNTHITLYDGMGLNTLNNFTFTGNASSVTVKGSGYGVNVNKNLASLDTALLTIKVQEDPATGIIAGTAVKVIDGASSDIINITKNITDKIIATGGTAIEIGGTVGRTITTTSDSNLKGDIKFTNGNVANSIDHAGKITGGITINGDGNNVLTLMEQSIITGNVEFGNGDNQVNINGGGVSVNSITMGAGTNTVSIKDVNSADALLLGNIDAGTGGNNTFELSNSKVIIDNSARITNFANYFLKTSTSLTLQHVDTIKAGNIDIDATSSLKFNELFNGNLSSNIQGTGDVAALNQSNVTLTGDNSNFSGAWIIDQGGSLSSDGDRFGTGNFALNGAVTIKNLNVFDHTVAGVGTLTINNTSSPDKEFNFAKNLITKDFSGTVNLVGSTFNLSGDNTTALTTPTLKVSGGAVVTVGKNDQNIGGFNFNGGQVNFHDISAIDGLLVSAGIIKAGILDIKDSGVVSIDSDATAFDPSNASKDYSTALEMDDANLIVRLIDGQSVVGGGGNLALVDKNGSVISNATDINLKNAAGIQNAVGTFDFRLATKDADLYMNYGLTVLKLIGTGDDAFDLISSDPTNNGQASNDLSSQITGAGDLRITGNNGAIISLSNSSNNYTGNTLVNQGTLSLIVDDALGRTSELSLGADASVLINDTKQVVGQLNTQSNSMVQFAGGELSIDQGGVVDGGLSGAGTVRLNAGTLEVKSSNPNLSGSVVLGQTLGSIAFINAYKHDSLGSSTVTLSNASSLNFKGASGEVANTLVGNGSVQLTQSTLILTKDSSTFTGSILIDSDSTLSGTAVNQLGSSSITNDGDLVLDIRTAGYGEVLTNKISGSGDLIKRGVGTLVLGANSNLTYSGKTYVNSGTLYLDGASIQSTDDVIVANNAMLQGHGEIFGTVENNGTLHVYQKDAMKSLGRATYQAELLIHEDVINNSHIMLQNNLGAMNNSLRIAGNYVGNNNAMITMGTKLGSNDATSQTDRLIIDGNVAGRTRLQINNVSGNSGQTTGGGILLVDVGGISDAQAFVLNNTVVDGAYEYTLRKGITNNSWYLTSLEKVYPEIPDLPDVPNIPGYSGNSSSFTPIYRPDFGNNLANALSVIGQQGNQSIGNIVGGAGGIRSIDRLRYNNLDKLSSIWNVTAYNKSKGHTANKQIHYDYDNKRTIFGADTSFFIGKGLLQVGGMVEFMRSTSHSYNAITESTGHGKVKGNQYSLYGTWYADANTSLSPFVDFIISYGRYKNTISTRGNDSSHYRSHMYSYTLQGGYPLPLISNLIIEPQAQLTYINYKADNYIDHTGTSVKQGTNGNIRARIGAYIYPDNVDFKPYAALNLWYDDVSARASYNNVSLTSDKQKFMLEAKVGLEANLSDDFSLSVEANYLKRKHKKHDYAVRVGLKYRF